MECEVEYTDEFGEWWATLDEDEQASVDASIKLLEMKGANLPSPYSSKVFSSKHSRMRELRIQHCGDPYRVLYAFDPRRMAILLLGGNKTGDDAWYIKNVPIADKLYDVHLKEIESEK